MQSVKQTIDQYIQETNANFKASDDAKKVAEGDQITVHYIGRLDEENIFDTSVESVAKAADKYHTQRDYTAGLPFKVGAGQMIAGFDKGVVGMQVGEIKTVHIPAAEAYGEYNPDLTVEVPMDKLPPKEGGFAVGDKLYTPSGHSFGIITVNEKSVVLDQNHDLAGKDLIFDITVIAID